MSDNSKILADASQAQLLLENEMLQDAFKILQETYTNALIDTLVEETAKREHLWKAIHAVGKVRDHLRIILEGGKLTRRELDELAYMQTRK